MATSTILDVVRDIGPILKENAARSDRERRLPEPSLAAMREAGLLRLYVPRALGGIELDPLSHALVQEELARHDSAAGWVLQGVSSSAWWCSRLPAKAVDEIYTGGPDQLFANSFTQPIPAERVDGGFVIDGQRPLTSFVSDAAWIGLNLAPMRDGQPEAIDGVPVTRMAFVPARDVTIVDTWDTIGMRGTDSHDIAFENIFVPEHRTFRAGIDHEPGRHYRGPLHAMSVLGMVATIGPNVALGLAREAIDELVRLARTKVPFASASSLRERGSAQASVGRAEGMLRAARCYLHDRIAFAWDHARSGAVLDLEAKAQILLACVQAHDAALHAVERMFGAAGTTAIYRRSRLEQIFRDVNVLRHHGFVSESRFETVGQVLLGLPPDLKFLTF